MTLCSLAYKCLVSAALALLALLTMALMALVGPAWLTRMAQ